MIWDEITDPNVPAGKWYEILKNKKENDNMKVLTSSEKAIRFFQVAIGSVLMYHENEAGPDEKIVPMKTVEDSFNINRGAIKFEEWVQLILDEKKKQFDRDPNHSLVEGEYRGILVHAQMCYLHGYGLDSIEETMEHIQVVPEDLSEPMIWTLLHSEPSLILLKDLLSYNEEGLDRVFFVGERKREDGVLEDIVTLLCEADYEGVTYYRRDEKTFTLEKEEDPNVYVKAYTYLPDGPKAASKGIMGDVSYSIDEKGKITLTHKYLEVNQMLTFEPQENNQYFVQEQSAELSIRYTGATLAQEKFQHCTYVEFDEMIECFHQIAECGISDLKNRANYANISYSMKLEESWFAIPRP